MAVLRWGAALVCAAVFASGCAIGAPRQQPPAQAGEPPALDTLQADAVSMIDSASARDWTRVNSQLAAIHQAWTTLRPDLAGRGVRGGLLDSTDRAISDLDHQTNTLSMRGTAVAANHLTAFTPDMLAAYTTVVPPQVAEMNYLGREIELNVDGGQTAAIWTNARTLGTQWALIRPAAQRVGQGDSARLDLQLADLDAAVSQAVGGSGAVPAAAGPAGPLNRLMPSLNAPSSSGAASAPSPGSSASSASGSSSTAAPSSSTSRAASTPRRNNNPAPAAAGSTATVRAAAAAVLDTLGAVERDFRGGR